MEWWTTVEPVAWTTDGHMLFRGLAVCAVADGIATDWWRVLTFQDYQTRLVVVATTLLGLSAGIVGTFSLLRRRALVGDALSHATLPGVALAYLVVTLLGFDGKRLAVLLAGAVVTGMAGMAAMLLIRRLTRLKEDAAMGIVLSVFFGAGLALLGVVQQLQTGSSAGLERFIFGTAASLVFTDAVLIGGTGLLCAAGCLALRKELTLLCFDEEFAAARGYPTVWLDVALMAAITLTTIVGLQAVGVVLMVALLVIPAAAARFWTDSVNKMVLIAGLMGGASGFGGSLISASYLKLPSGPMIVLVAVGWFIASLLLGRRRGVLMRWWRQHDSQHRADRQHLLRAAHEYLETTRPPDEGEDIPRVALQQMRAWDQRELQRAVSRCLRRDLVIEVPHDRLRLTALGKQKAAAAVRMHRLWELYLMTHSDLAHTHLDDEADLMEHVLDADVIRELEQLLPPSERMGAPVASPHPLTEPRGGLSS